MSIFDYHHFQQCADVAVVLDFEMKVFLRKAVCGRIEKKMEQPGIRRQQGKEGAEKSFTPDQHANDDGFLIIMHT